MSGIRETLPELISRVESGEGADREIDCLVAALADIQVEGVQHSWRSLVHQFGIEWAVDVATRHTSVWRTEVPRYATSLDAVLSLIEKKLPGWCWEAKHAIGCHAIVWQVCKDYDDEGCKTVGFHMSSASRAFLAACLRAILESRPEHADANSKSPTQAREE